MTVPIDCSFHKKVFLLCFFKFCREREKKVINTFGCFFIHEELPHVMAYFHAGCPSWCNPCVSPPRTEQCVNATLWRHQVPSERHFLMFVIFHVWQNNCQINKYNDFIAIQAALSSPLPFFFAFKKCVIQKICSKTQTQFLLIVVSKVSVTFNFCAVVTLAF